MGKIKNRVWVVILMELFTFPFISACAATKPTANDGSISGLNDWVIEKVLENYEDGVGISASDIVIDQIFYGSFSQEDTSEILVVCKILNTPHVAGLEQKVCVLLNDDTWEMIAYKLFKADETVISCMQTSSGQSRILFLGTWESTGVRSQCVELYAIQNSEWVNMTIDIMQAVPTEKRELLEDNCFCYIAGDRMVVVYEENYHIAISSDVIANPIEVIAIFIWDPYTEQFALKQ